MKSDKPVGFFKIQLTQGKEALVNAEDFLIQSRYKWSAMRAKKTWYAVRNVSGKSVTLHRAILSPPKSQMVDHINGNGLDNRRQNLRACTPAQNTFNKRSASEFKGITYVTKTNKWVAKIGFNKKYYYIGTFKLKEDAAKAYDTKARELHGEFTVLNFP